MKIDIYTKTVLSIIAICLVWICVRDVTISRSAQANAPQPVVVTGYAQGVKTPVVIREINLDGAPRSYSILHKDRVLPVQTINLQ